MSIAAVALFVFILYSLLVACLIGSLFFNRSKSSEAGCLISDESLPFITVLIPAKNEESHIFATVSAFAKQQYPQNRFELIVVDDGSTDATGFQAQQAGSILQYFRLLSMTERTGALMGKQSALHYGVMAAQGSIIVQTDADCMVQPEFLKRYAEAFATGYDFVFGRTAIQTNGLLDELEAADLRFLFMVAGASANWGFPLSCMGNNVGFRKQSYLDLGGYPKLGPSMIEDYQLLTAFRRAGLKSCFLGTGEPLVITTATGSLIAFLRQRVRWARGSFVINPLMNLLTGTLVVSNLLALLMLLGGLILQEPLLLAIFATKVTFDFAAYGASCIYFKEQGGIRFFPFWEGYYLLSPILIAFMMIFRPSRSW